MELKGEIIKNWRRQRKGRGRIQETFRRQSHSFIEELRKQQPPGYSGAEERTALRLLTQPLGGGLKKNRCKMKVRLFTGSSTSGAKSNLFMATPLTQWGFYLSKRYPGTVSELFTFN